MLIQERLGPIEDFLEVLSHWDQLLSGYVITMWIYGLSLLMGFLLGIFLALSRQYGGKFFSRLSTGYIEIMRGTPLLTQIILFYYLPLSLNIPIARWSVESNFLLFNKEISIVFLNQATLVGILTLGLNSAAYQAEYIRGSIVSINKEQLIAAQSLGMTHFSGILHVVIPQALRRVIPAWSNEAAYLPKYTVVVFFIGVNDLFHEAYIIVSQEVLSLATYIIVGIIFLITITIISKLLDYIHKRTKIPGL